MQPAVVFDGVWKKFRKGQRHDSLRDLLPSVVKRALLGRDDIDSQEFWALSDVSFSLHPGKALGIIGQNGAGKSTALKLLTRILKPTKGRAMARGRVGALIEVAAGFHPDLTGRENIFLQAAIIGMKQTDVAAQFTAIVEFAGVGEFIDTPVKRYSSGMNARLGFSIAAHLRPDVLIIDEVLSVGDVMFQQRCLDRMLEFKRQGVAIVFVSHDLGAVATLCDEAVLLNRKVLAAGSVSDVLETFASACVPDIETSAEVDFAGALLQHRGRPLIEPVAPGTPLTVTLHLKINQRIPGLILGFVIYRATDMLVVYDGNFSDAEHKVGDVSATGRAAVEFHFLAHLTRGHYLVELHGYDPASARFLFRRRPGIGFTVDERRTYAGVADLAVTVRSLVSQYEDPQVTQ